MPPHRVTQAEIAKIAGVHSTTVSLALRNHPSLPIETRERIQALAEKAGYRPDPFLRSLMSYRRSVNGTQKHVSTVAYVTNWHTKNGWKQAPAHRQFYEGAANRAQQLGYQLEHFWLGETGLSDQRLSDILRARGIDGAIVASYWPGFNKRLQLDWTHLCAVKIDFFPLNPELHNITNDQCAIIRLAMRQTMAAGYRRIGFILPKEFDDFVNQAWSAGYLVEQQKIAPADRIPMLTYAPWGSPTFHTVAPRALFEDWYRTYRPEVLISCSLFLQPLLEEMHLSIPRDVAFVDVFLENTDGGTAGVRQNCLRVGERAIEIVAEQVEHNAMGVPSFPTTTLIEGTWFDGATLPSRVQASSAKTVQGS